MKNAMKTLMVCLVVTLAFVMVRSTAMAQVGFGFPPLWQYPAFSSQPLTVPTWENPLTGTGDILVDNFEYWDSPYNHGWLQSEPAYPVYGFGMGYATIFNTVLDLQQGSRVLDVYRPASIFLIGTPYEKHAILKGLQTPASAANTSGAAGIVVSDPNATADTVTNPIVSFDFRAPMGIEPWDIFQMVVIGANGDNAISVVLTPLDACAGGGCLGPMNSTKNMYGMAAAVTGYNEAGQLEVSVNLGRGLLDGSWHAVWVNLYDAVKAAVDSFDDIAAADRADWYLEVATGVLISGQMFRMDNLMFRADYALDWIENPDFFEIGPLYAQIFEPYRYLFMADYGVGEGGLKIYDLLLDPAKYFITDPNDIEAYWVSIGASDDPNIMGKVKDPNISEIIGRDFVVDRNLPVFADANMNLQLTAAGLGTGAEALRDMGTLGWNATVNSYGANAIQAFLLQPLAVYPYDGMPTYIPAYYDALNVVKSQGVCGKPYFGPGLVFVLESALWNAGITVWPNIASMDYTPQYFEDLIMTVEVTNGANSDVRTFPISVVNYPVENYNPVVQLNVNDQIFYVGQIGEYLINFIDPDCFIYSLSPAPATTHMPGFPVSGNFRTDMDSMYWQMTLNGLPNYQYGPWVEQIITPCSGLISWVPKFEGAYDAIVTCTDARGGVGFGEVTIFAVNCGTWLNHPPIILSRPTQPVVIKAGEEFILRPPNLSVEDPDGEPIYASCNIGQCGRAPDGSFLWKFQSNFPGSYVVEVIFYDIRGGYAIMNFFLDVKPWWSY